MTASFGVSAGIANGALRRSFSGLILPRHAGTAEVGVVRASAGERCPSRTGRCSGGGFLITVVAGGAQLFRGIPGEVWEVAQEAWRAGIERAAVEIGCCFAFAEVTGLLLEVAKLASPRYFALVEDGLKCAVCQRIVHESSVGDGYVHLGVDGGSLCRDGAMRGHAHGIRAACSNVTWT